MKKELLALLQFTLIAALVGFGFFCIALFRDASALSFWGEYKLVLANWLLTFIALSFVRFTFFYLIFSSKIHYSVQKNRNFLLGKEVSKTIQYLILAIISVLFPFWIPIFQAGNEASIVLNTTELQRGFKQVFFAWLIGFVILSLVRLGIICIKEVKTIY